MKMQEILQYEIANMPIVMHVVGWIFPDAVSAYYAKKAKRKHRKYSEFMNSITKLL